MNNLLTVVLANVELALGDALDETWRDCLSDAAVAGRRAAAVVRQLLAFAGGTVLALEPLELGALVRKAVERAAAGAPGTQVRCRVAGGPLRVLVDRDQLGLALQELLSNAVDAARDADGVVEVEVARGPTGEATVTVTDHGGGINAELLDRIWDPCATTKGPGRGLGLAAARRAVERLGGCVWLESAAGAGTVAKVLLPPRPRGDSPSPG